MAYSDNPIADRFAGNSDKAERSLQNILTMQAGFICRQEHKDYGCDFDVELIVNGTNVSNWRFPIQLKSIEKLNLVDDKMYISYPIATSRLGYLMRRLPAMGIIVFYSLEEDKCYYEYSDKIYAMLMDERGSDDWKSNETVKARIPYANVLDEASAKLLHKTFLYRFEQAVVMQKSHGPKYGLPIYDPGGESKYDFNNLSDIERFLSDYGMMMLHNYDVGTLYKMIVQIPNQTIFSNKTLLWVAAIACCEVGLYAESEIYCKRLGSKNTLGSEEKITLQFTQLKNKFCLGYIDTDQFLDEMKSIDIGSSNGHNKLAVQISILNYELLRVKPWEDIPEHLIKQLDQIFQSTIQSNCSLRTKGLLMIWNCRNLSFIMLTQQRKEINGFCIKESLGVHVGLAEKKNLEDFYFRSQEHLFNIVKYVIEIASAGNDSFLRAYIMSFEVGHFIQSQITFLLFDVSLPKSKELDHMLRSFLEYSQAAYNHFLSLHLRKEAYDSLCNTLEIIELSENWYDTKVSTDKESLYNTKKQMESELDLAAVILYIPDIIHARKKLRDGKNIRSMSHLKNLEDFQLEDIAMVTLKTLNLNPDRLVNVLNELKAYRLFYQRCTDDDIHIFEDRDLQEPAIDRYKKPVKFVLLNKKTGRNTTSSSDIDALLKSFEF